MGSEKVLKIYHGGPWKSWIFSSERVGTLHTGLLLNDHKAWHCRSSSVMTKHGVIKHLQQAEFIFASMLSINFNY